MKVYEALANAFVAEGTAAVFGLMGDRNQHWIESLVDRGVPMYEVRHEGAGCTMAEGWARRLGSPGVCTATSGPGTTQLATALVAAARSRTPVVAFCGDTRWGDTDANQRFNQERFALGTECTFVRVATAQDALEAVQHAFLTARLESRPVLLGAPDDIQKQEIDEDEPYVPSTALMPATSKHPSPAALEQAAELIAAAERPVLLIGRGAIAAGAGEVVLRLAERVGALVATSLMAINWLREREPFHAGVSGLFATRTAMELFQDCDCVIGVGASLNLYTTEHGYLFPNARFVHVDQRPNVVMGDGRLAECYIEADARLALDELDELLDRRGVAKVGYRTDETRKRLEEVDEDPAEFDLEPGTLDPRAVCTALDEAIPSALGFTLGVGNHSNFPAMAFLRERPYTLVIKEFGSVGQGLPTAIGGIVADGMRPGFLVDGDAGFMMHLAEFETAVRYGVPLLTIVMNNEALGAEYHAARRAGLDPELARIPTPDLGGVAIALGGRGRLVRSLEELRIAIAEFLADPGPYVADVRISREVLDVPSRRRAGDDRV